VSKHTPGPWVLQRFIETGLDPVEDKDYDPNRARVVGSDGGLVVHSSWVMSDADKALIAAAPDMLEALVEAENILILLAEGNFDAARNRLVKIVSLYKVRQAIAKATGGAE
jgi:hypothetical protein